MNGQRKTEITRLAIEAHDKRLRYQMLGMMNTPSDPEESRKAAAEYAIAEAEMMEAQHLLAREQRD